MPVAPEGPMVAATDVGQRGRRLAPAGRHRFAPGNGPRLVARAGGAGLGSGSVR